MNARTARELTLDVLQGVAAIAFIALCCLAVYGILKYL